MKTILEHTKLIGNLEKNKICISLVSKYNLQDLVNCCKRIKNSNLNQNLYHKNLAIQKELITNEAFINYLLEIERNNIDLARLGSLCSILQDHNETICNYNLDILLQILKNTNIIEDAFYDYLKYFSNNIKHKKNKIL